MPQNKPTDQLEREALTVLTQWRGADRRAIDDKGDANKQRAEYACRKSLRTAADNLSEAHHG